MTERRWVRGCPGCLCVRCNLLTQLRMTSLMQWNACPTTALHRKVSNAPLHASPSVSQAQRRKFEGQAMTSNVEHTSQRNKLKLAGTNVFSKKQTQTSWHNVFSNTQTQTSWHKRLNSTLNTKLNTIKLNQAQAPNKQPTPSKSNQHALSNTHFHAVGALQGNGLSPMLVLVATAAT